MATKIFYKEIPDEDDPSENVPVAIDTLFLPKYNLADKVIKERETDILDVEIDLNNLFEEAEDNLLPSAHMMTGERTNIHVENDLLNQHEPKYPHIVSVNKSSKKRIYSSGYYGDIMGGNQSFNVPKEYQDRWMFYVISIHQFGSRKNDGQFELTVCGDFISPGNQVVHTKTPRTYTTRDRAQQRWHVYFFECEMGETIDNTTDLSHIFASKEVDYSYSGPNWWVPYLCMNNATNRSASSFSSATVSNLAKPSFIMSAMGCEHDDEWHTVQPIASLDGKRKNAGVSTISFSRENGRRWTYVVGLEWYTRIWW